MRWTYSHHFWKLMPPEGVMQLGCIYLKCDENGASYLAQISAINQRHTFDTLQDAKNWIIAVVTGNLESQEIPTKSARYNQA